MEKNMYDIKKPLLKDKKWLIFPDAILSDIKTADCNDTMEGKCYENTTLEECIKRCEKSTRCNYGYYITGRDKKNICVPLLDLGKENNPIYRIRNKEIYPELKNSDTKTFINKTVFPFPPEQANNVFFMDNFNIQNVETCLWLDSSPLVTNEKNVFFNGHKTDEHLTVQFIQIPPNLSVGVQYVRVSYGEDIAINIPHTTLIFRESEIYNKIEWVSRVSALTHEYAFQLVPIDGKKKGDDVLFSDKFAIKTKEYFLGIDDYGNLVKLYYSTYEEANQHGHSTTFRLVPQMEGYYCNNDSQCTRISLTDMEVNHKGIGKIDGLSIGRNPGCWGVCKYKVNNQPRLKPLEIYTTESKSFYWVPIIVPCIIVPCIIIIIIAVIITMKK